MKVRGMRTAVRPLPAVRRLPPPSDHSAVRPLPHRPLPAALRRCHPTKIAPSVHRFRVHTESVHAGSDLER
jgi:hypothetical protein